LKQTPTSHIYDWKDSPVPRVVLTILAWFVSIPLIACLGEFFGASILEIGLVLLVSFLALLLLTYFLVEAFVRTALYYWNRRKHPNPQKPGEQTDGI